MVEEIFKYANDMRYGTQSSNVKDETITITDSLAEELQNINFTSKTRGRMCALLKKKSKMGKEMKPRKTFEPLNFMQRFRDSKIVVESPKQ